MAAGCRGDPTIGFGSVQQCVRGDSARSATRPTGRGATEQEARRTKPTTEPPSQLTRTIPKPQPRHFARRPPLPAYAPARSRIEKRQRTRAHRACRPGRVRPPRARTGHWQLLYKPQHASLPCGCACILHFCCRYIYTPLPLPHRLRRRPPSIALSRHLDRPVISCLVAGCCRGGGRSTERHGRGKGGSGGAGGVVAALRQRLPADAGAAQGAALRHQGLPPQPRYVRYPSPPPPACCVLQCELPSFSSEEFSRASLHW